MCKLCNIICFVISALLSSFISFYIKLSEYLASHTKKVVGLIPDLRPLRVHRFSLSLPASSRSPKNMHVRSTGHSKLSAGVRVNGCLVLFGP